MSLDRRTLLAAAASLAASKAIAAPAAPSSADPLGIRADFPITTRDEVYLNSAYKSPIPRQVIAAGTAESEFKSLTPLGEEPDHGQQVRERFARLINAEPGEVGLIGSTGEGENIVAWGLGLKPGDNIVMSSLHYDTEFILYRVIEKELGVEFRIVPHREGRVEARDMEPHVDKRTRLITVAWVSHQNGYVHDLKSIGELAHAHGAYLYADVIQGVGTIPLDVKAGNVDFAAANGHKWMLSTHGLAPFYCRRELIDKLHIERYGEGQIAKRFPNRQYSFVTDARRFEISDPSEVAAAQLAASLAYIDQVGLSRIAEHTIAMGLRLQRGLAAQGHRMFTPEGNRSPIVVYYIKMSPAEAKAKFAAARINVTARDGTVRIAPALFNTDADIDRCLDVAKTVT